MSVEDGAVAALVGERHALEADVAPHLVEHLGAGPVLDGGLGVEHLVDAHGGALGLAGQRHDPRQDLQREGEHQHVGDEGHQAAEREPAGAHRQHAGQQDEGERDVGDEGEHPHEARVEGDALHLRVVDLAGLGLVAGEGDVAPAEGLQHPDALGALLDGGGEVAGLVLDAADDLHVAQLEAAAQHEHGDRGREGEQGEARVQGHQHAEDRQHLHEDEDEEDGPEADEAPHDAEVGHGPRQELARLPPVVEADVEALELGVEVVAEVRLQPGGQDREQEAAPEGEEHLDEGDDAP